MTPLVLASTSPRRSELMRRAGYEFTAVPSTAVEWPWDGREPAEYAESLARAKAAGAPGEVVVGADTVVVVDGRVLGKPADPDDAARMLRRLSGRWHEVITAVAVRDGGHLRWWHSRARVRFRDLSAAEILEYLATGEPMDKAGAYAIQGGGAGFVEDMEGDLDTVVGLPMALLRRLLPDRIDGGR